MGAAPNAGAVNVLAGAASSAPSSSLRLCFKGAAGAAAPRLDRPVLMDDAAPAPAKPGPEAEAICGFAEVASEPLSRTWVERTEASPRAFRPVGTTTMLDAPPTFKS